MNTHFTSIQTVLLILAMTSCSAVTHAAGTIWFANSSTTRVQLYQGGGTTVPVPRNAQIVYGVFWGTNSDELTLVQPLGTSSTIADGLIVAPTTYTIPGTEGGQTVFIQIRGWSAAYGTDWQSARFNFASFGQTDIRQVTLAPASGPGTAIWSATAGNPNKFFPLILGLPLTPPAILQLGSPLNFPVTVDEGNHGTVDAIIPVVRYTPPGVSTNLDFVSTAILSTTNITALAGEDYAPTNVVVTFNPGETLHHVRIKIIADTQPEPDEQFGVYLKSNGSFVSVDQYVLNVTIREARVITVRREATNAVVTIRTTISQRYALEYSPDMIFWSAVPGAQNIAGTGGNVQITDSSQACCDPRFYRTRLLP